MDAVCDLVVDLVHAYVAARPERLCLHAAAVETASGILLIPSTYRSGKSTLATALAARGARLFSDDVAPLGPAGEVEALGMLPRLRLPLPAGLGAAAQALTAAHPGPTSARYRYLALDAAGLAPRGTRRPVAAIVTLERAEGAAPALMEGDADHALQHLLLRNFARGPLPSRIFLRLRRLAAAVPCYRLRYGEAAEGAALLAERFAPLAPREVLDRAG
ncbi:hypothetical protein [Inmirania thermothiophila]|uniref:hypothetical protein n=1 Tax=Inmirania thermothiophila TaxID=1750597 RepID=UPI0014758689|nr:hypothetical protein [Inmirania thermothiophila]